MTELTPEKRAELRALCKQGLLIRGATVSLLDALDAKDADFKRMAYLGNLARSRTTEEQDELAALVRKAAK